jgi:hypothetical protein
LGLAEVAAIERGMEATDQRKRGGRQERDSRRLPRLLWLPHYAGE